MKWDVSELDRRGISVLDASFTPDFRYLLRLSNLPAIYVYDTRTWVPVNNLQGVPAGATAFTHPQAVSTESPCCKTAKSKSPDVSKGQKQSDLDLQGDLQDVSFSEDDCLFAESSVRHNADSSSAFGIRVWDTNTGEFVREMIPPYYFEHDVISRPMWWGNGKYLLANIRAGHWGGYMIAAWSVRTGQLRGEFSACDGSQDPFEAGIDGPRLLKWCFDEALLV